MTKNFAILLILVFTSPAFAADRDDFGLMQALGDTRYHPIEAKSLGQTYHVFVRVPADYADNPQKKYQTLYLLDGGWLYPLLSSYYHYLYLSEEVPNLIIVGISYGTDDYGEGNNRSRDYTAPTDEREHWGGAADFQQFLRSELFPLIESTYRSDSNQRVIFGQSLGGQFVLYTALTDPSLFWGHIASNPALHRNLPFFLRDHSQLSSHDTKLFVSSASGDDPRFRGPALEWIRHWEGEENRPFQLKTITLEGHSHLSAPPQAFRQGMAWLFPR